MARWLDLTAEQQAEVVRRCAAGERASRVGRDFGLTAYVVRRHLPFRRNRNRCMRGHPYTEANTRVRVRYVWRQGTRFGPYTVRECRTCAAMIEVAGYYGGRRAKRRGVKQPRHPNLTVDQAVRSAEVRRRRWWSQ